MSEQAILLAEGITQSYEGTSIISDVTLSLKPGELACLLGISGSGKTTLFHVISGLARPDSGRVWLKGTDITGRPGHISYMLQKDLLLPHKRILDNVALPLVIRGEGKHAAREKAAALFERFGLSGTQKKYPAQLSGGMRQRAALLRTYLGSDGVALLDEPFSALDALTKRAMHRWYLDVMSELSLATLFITHDIDEAITISDRIHILGGTPGRIQATFEITPPRPRDEEFPLSSEFAEYKREILFCLKL